MWLVRSWLLGLVAAISLLAQGASQAEPVKIRVSWIAPLSNWASLLMEKKELARHMGQSYILEPVRYAGTPQQIIDLLHDAFGKAIRDPEVQQKFAVLGFKAVGTTPAETAQRIKDELALWVRVAREANLQQQPQ